MEHALVRKHAQTKDLTETERRLVGVFGYILAFSIAQLPNVLVVPNVAARAVCRNLGVRVIEECRPRIRSGIGGKRVRQVGSR